MGKNIIVCCDGTGNEYGSTNTNVVKLFGVLDLTDDTKQIGFYDPGVGTAPRPGAVTWIRKKLSMTMGLVFGAGINRNIHDAYAYLMESYRPGDRVYLFGFSRGAYTVRALTGMLHMYGLLHPGNSNLIPYVIKMYRKKRLETEDFDVARGFLGTYSRKCEPHFVGLWDTVKSVGLWDVLKFGRGTRLAYTFRMPDMIFGRHAVAIDEKRSRFRTNRWKRENGEEYQQVWFAGVHSDVGGGYKEAGLSDIALRWMLDGAVQRELLVDSAKHEAIVGDVTEDAHNSLLPIWWILGWKRRTIPPGAWIHHSVKKRIKKRTDYRPEIPEDARFVD